MKTRSAWARGLFYGGVFGAVMCLFPLAGVVIANPPWNEVAMALGITFLIWGSLGFLAGFCNDADEKSDVSSDSLPRSLGTRIMFWLYRFVAGFLLSLIAYSLVGGFGAAVMLLWMGDLDAPTKRRISDEEMQLAFVGICGFLGVWTGSVSGCWLGAMLVPRGPALGGVANEAFFAAALGGLAAGWFGASVGLLHPLYLTHEQAAISALIAGAVVGIGTAIVIRKCAFRLEPH